MNITYKEIKPLVADATFSNNRILCKFQDPATSQVILSAADVPQSIIGQSDTKATYSSLFKKALSRINLSREIAKSAEEQEAIIQAFQKVSHLFEKENGVMRMKR